MLNFTDGTMSKLSLKQTAEFAGTTKPTILKHMAKGRVSGEKDDNGQWWFDMAELVRAYGEPGSRNTSSNGSLSSRNPQDLQQDIPAETVAELATLRTRLQAMEQERERERRDKEATIEDLRTRLDHEAEERRRLTMLLTDQRPRAKEQPPRGFLAWLRGAQ